MADDLVEAIRIWQAKNWSDFRKTWRDLRPNYDEPPRPPRFRDVELDQQKAGWLFERLVPDAFRLDGVSGHYPYEASKREQVDGLIVIGRQGFLVESKYQEKRLGIDPIYRLHVLVEHRPAGALGLLFSGSGFTQGARESAQFLKPIRILLFEPLDLEWAFQDEGRMMAMVRRKWAFALKLGRPDMPIARIDGAGKLVTEPIELFKEDWDDGFTSSPIAHGKLPGTTLPSGTLP
jgi:hypothetical protein